MPGTAADAPYIALSAHIDTVFPAGTEISVTREGSKLYGPGISDNSSGIVALLAIAGALRDAAIVNLAPILFIGSVGEEGEGDLRGMRHIFQQRRWLDTIGTVIAVDGAGTDTIIAEGLGSRRYEITVTGVGGHSWSDFGVANPIVALARVIERFTRTPVPTAPKTTYNIGTIHGGTSVNSIPQVATMRVDTRSASVEELDRLERALRESLELVLAAMPGRNRKEMLTSETKIIGDRPAADLPLDSRLLQSIRAVDAQLRNVARIQRASTDANIPLSLGREALAMGAGGSGGGAHTLNEWYDPAGRDLGLKRILLLTLTLSGRGRSLSGINWPKLPQTAPKVARKGQKWLGNGPKKAKFWYGTHDSGQGASFGYGRNKAPKQHEKHRKFRHFLALFRVAFNFYGLFLTH